MLKEQVNYTPEELEYRAQLIQKLESARDMRDTAHTEFDGQTYKEYYISNVKAANAYIPPKTNEQDVRVTSGTTLEKKGTLLTALLNYNFEPDIEAFDDEDRLVHELGEIQEDLVKKSRKIECPEYSEKRLFIYDELLNQGSVTVEDTFVEYHIPDRDVGQNPDFTNLKSLKWAERLDKIYRYCDTNLLTGLNVYFGNFREPFIQKQPFVFTRRLLSRPEAQAIYGDWERWKNVPEAKTDTLWDNNDSLPYNNWSLEEYTKAFTEEIKFQDKWSNNYMVMLNGVMMFPVAKDEKKRYLTMPLSSLNGECEYNLAHAVLNRIPNCAYGKSIPSKTKVDQAIFDEMLKMVVLKTRKSYMPPMSNRSKKTLSKKIFDPGYITNDIRPEDLQEIGRNDGVTMAEFNAISFIRGIIDSKSVSPIMEGMAPETQATARQIIEQKQQSLMKIGLSVLAVISLERQLSWLRIKNIMRHWTEAVDERAVKIKDALQTISKYRSVSVDSAFEDGEKGIREIRFSEDLPESGQIFAEEKLRKDLTGKNYRINYLNPKLYKNLNYRFYIEIVPTEKSTSDLKAAMFDDFVRSALALGSAFQKMPNMDYLLTRHAILNGENPDKIWGGQEVQQMSQGMPQQMLQQGQRTQQMMPRQAQKPSINALAQGR